jgi:hypothetical protein
MGVNFIQGGEFLRFLKNFIQAVTFLPSGAGQVLLFWVVAKKVNNNACRFWLTIQNLPKKHKINL